MSSPDATHAFLLPVVDKLGQRKQSLDGRGKSTCDFRQGLVFEVDEEETIKRKNHSDLRDYFLNESICHSGALDVCLFNQVRSMDFYFEVFPQQNGLDHNHYGRLVEQRKVIAFAKPIDQTRK